MTAIDELCRLLEERNEEYDRRVNSGGLPSYVLVCWYFNLADRAYFYGYPDGRTKLITYRCTYDLTPEQAIAATLGDTDATGGRQGDADLAAENAKLRELVKITYAFFAWADGATFSDGTPAVHACDRREVEDRMRELGIEVD